MTAVASKRETIRDIPIELYAHGEYVSDRIRQTKDFYEAELLDRLGQYIHGGIAVDVGAMIGNHTLYFAHFLDVEGVEAFEPHPGNFAILARNTADLPIVNLHPIALSDKAGILRLEEYEQNMGATRASKIGIQVGCDILDAFHLEDVTLLKIDVEYHEPQVLDGARDTIERWRPYILIEDLDQVYEPLLPKYRKVPDWPRVQDQTDLYEWVG